MPKHAEKRPALSDGEDSPVAKKARKKARSPSPSVSPKISHKKSKVASPQLSPALPPKKSKKSKRAAEDEDGDALANQTVDKENDVNAESDQEKKQRKEQRRKAREAAAEEAEGKKSKKKSKDEDEDEDEDDDDNSKKNKKRVSFHASLGTANEFKVSVEAADKDAPAAQVLVQGSVAVAPTPVTKFSDASLQLPKNLRKALDAKFTHATPIQAVAWPLLLEGRADVLGIAKTGSGKTLAFSLPFMSLHARGDLALSGKDVVRSKCQPSMVAMTPTRELALQVAEVCEEFGKTIDIKVVATIGGVPKREQTQLIRQGVDIVVATPGRLADFAQEGTLDLSKVAWLVLDEADRMLDMGFWETVSAIVDQMPNERQSLLFSATWPSDVDKLGQKLTRSGHRVKISVASVRKDTAGAEDPQAAAEGDEFSGELKMNEMITQDVVVMQDARNKQKLLYEALVKHKDQRILIFALYKREAAELERMLCQSGYTAKAIQGDMTQAARTEALQSFKDGACPILVATDVASRGIDIKGIDLVINYTFPLTVEDFVHRCGRTGRAGTSGKALTFFNVAGAHKEKEHAFNLIRVLQTANQPVPANLQALSNTTFTATKKKAHGLYGNFYKTAEQMKELEAKKTHITFDSDSD